MKPLADQIRVVVQKPQENPLVLKDWRARRFTIGPTLDCTYTFESSMVAKRHHLIRRRYGENYLMVPMGVSCELKRTASKDRIDLKSLLPFGLIEKLNGTFAVPFPRGTQAVLRFGDTVLGIEYSLPSEKTASQSLPWDLRISPLSKSDWLFLLILFCSLSATFLAMWRIHNMEFLPAIVSREEVYDRYAKLILETPVEVRDFPEWEKEQEKKEEAEKTEPGKKSDRSPAKRTSQRIQDQGLLGYLEKRQTSQRILESQELKGAFQGVGVLTTKRPSGSATQGPALAYRESSSVEDIVAGIAGRQGKEIGGHQKETTRISNPFEVRGQGAQHALRSYEEIDRIIRRHLQGIRFLYERHLRKNPALQGRITYRFTIDAQGKVTAVQVTSSTMQHAAFEQEVAERIRLWQFPAIDASSGSVSVVYPFSFLPKRD